MPQNQVVNVISNEGRLEAIVEVDSTKTVVHNLAELQVLIDQYVDPLDANAALRLLELSALQWLFKPIDLDLSESLWEQAVTELGRLLVEAGRLEDAVWISTKTWFVEGERVIKSLVASELIKQGRLEQAIDVIPDLYPDQAEFRAKISLAFCKIQRLDDALEVLNHIKARQYITVRALVEISDWLREQGDSHADEVLNEAHSYTASLHYSDKIKSLVILGRYDAALTEARTAPRPPDRPRSLAELALDLATHDKNLSLQIIQESHAANAILDDKNFDKKMTLEILVKALVANDQIDQAILLTQELAEIDAVTTANGVLTQMALAQCRQGNIDHALRLANEISDEYDKLQTFQWLVRILATKRDIRAHEVMAYMLNISQHFLKADPEDIQDQLAKAFGSLGRFAEAIKNHFPFDSEEFIEDIAKWSPALETSSQGLSLQVLERVIRIVIAVQPAWQDIYTKIFVNQISS